MDNIRLKLYGSFVTALAFVSYILYAMDFFRIKVSMIVVLTSFWISFLSYLYFRLSKRVSEIRLIFIVGSIITFVCLFYFFQYNLLSFILLGFNGAVLLLYHSFFRKKLFLKPMIIAISWLTWIYVYTLKFNMIFYIQQFVFIWMLTFPFDINGMMKDKIKTFPKIYGVKKTILLIRSSCLIYVLLGLLLSEKYFLHSILMTAILNLILSDKRTFKGIYVYLFYDGIIVFQYILWKIMMYLN